MGWLKKKNLLKSKVNKDGESCAENERFNLMQWMTMKRLSHRRESTETNTSNDTDVTDDSYTTSDESIPKSILKKSTASTTSRKRQVHFNANTFFQLINEDGEKVTGSEYLCLESRQDCLNRIMSNNGLSTQLLPDEVHGTKLYMCIQLDKIFTPEDLSVRSSKCGQKIRIIANKVVDGETVMEYRERIPLVVKINPLLVDARMDDQGNLKILAPVASNDAMDESGPKAETNIIDEPELIDDESVIKKNVNNLQSTDECIGFMMA